MSRKGIDCSHHQGHIDWAKVKFEGYDFAIVKASQGLNYRDPKLSEYVHGAKNAGLQVAAYHFGTADEDGVKQAENFLSAIRGLEPLLGVTLENGSVVRAWFDLEDNPSGVAWSEVPAAVRVSRVGDFLRTVDTRLNTRTGIYCSPGWFDGLFHNVDWSGHPLWLARYKVESPGTCGKWKAPSIWQYDEFGKCPGISGDVDLNVML